MKALAQSSSAVLFLCCLALTSCSTPTALTSQRDPTVAVTPEASNSCLLYLRASPHRRIYVEVDAVEGCAPTEVALQQLRNFLATYCNKPDGIEVVRSDVIPVKAARGISPRALARKYMNGPDTTNASPPTFMYVLYYDYILSRDSAAPAPAHRGASTAPARRPQIASPYADLYLYPAIYFNTGYSLGLAMNEILLHETGHLLGMVNRPDATGDGHCVNPGCQMNNGGAYLRQFRWLPGRRQSPLCSECVAELKQRSRQSFTSNLRFVGPLLVRSETDYHVVSLPDRVGLIAGSLSAEDCKDFAATTREEQVDPEDDDRLSFLCQVKDDVLKDSAKLSEIADRIKADPVEPVRVVGPTLFLEACSDRYAALGRYTNAVEVLHQAILLDPKNARLYNNLAWIEATCADDSVRNGEEAVSAATKACELTQWKDGAWIDTLAAAYAEARDFKRAIEFQERALRAGSQSESEQKAMRERLSLYKQSIPFREKADKP